jgi:O-antigen ligase
LTQAAVASAPALADWVSRFRLIPAALAAGAPALLGVAMVLTSGDMKVALFLATVTVGIVWAVVYWPEFLVIAYFLAGRYGFEDRLAPGELPFSANQVAFVAVLALLAIHGRHVIAVMRTWTVSFLVLFTAVLTLGILWSRGPEYGTYKVMHTLFVVLPSSMVMLALIHRRQSLLPFLAALFGLGLGLDAVGLATFETSVQVGRLTSLGSGPIVLARVVGAALLVSVVGGIHFLRTPTGRWWEIGLGIGGLLCALPLLAGFVLTQSRGPAVALVLALGIYAAISFATDWRRLVAILLLTAAALVGAGFVIEEFAAWSRFDMEHPANMVSLDGRREMLNLSVSVVLQNPIFGVGTGGWPVAVYGLDMRTYPHNFFVEIAAEHGVVITGLLVALFGAMSVRWAAAYRRAGSEDRSVLVLTLVLFVYLFGNIQFSGDLIDNRLLWILMGAMELAIVFSAPTRDRGDMLVASDARLDEEFDADATGDVGPPGT